MPSLRRFAGLALTMTVALAACGCSSDAEPKDADPSGPWNCWWGARGDGIDPGDCECFPPKVKDRPAGFHKVETCDGLFTNKSICWMIDEPDSTDPPENEPFCRCANVACRQEADRCVCTWGSSYYATVKYNMDLAICEGKVCCARDEGVLGGSDYPCHCTDDVPCGPDEHPVERCDAETMPYDPSRGLGHFVDNCNIIEP